jgi:hypothetical protein
MPHLTLTGGLIMKRERITIDNWSDNGVDITEGIVLAHSPRIEDINEFSNDFKGNAAVWYTGQLLPQGTYFL